MSTRDQNRFNQLIIQFLGEINRRIDDCFANISGHGIAETQSTDIFRCDAPGGASAWAGTFTAAGSSGSTIKYATTSGTAAAMTPTSTAQYGKMVLYNTTRGNSVLIFNHVAGTITSTENYPGNWVNGDVLTIVSQTVSGGSFAWVDIQITSGPTGYIDMFFMLIMSSATVGHIVLSHPFETYSASKLSSASANIANVGNRQLILMKVTGNTFSIAWTGTPIVVIVTEQGYLHP